MAEKNKKGLGNLDNNVRDVVTPSKSNNANGKDLSKQIDKSTSKLSENQKNIINSVNKTSNLLAQITNGSFIDSFISQEGKLLEDNFKEFCKGVSDGVDKLNGSVIDFGNNFNDYKMNVVNSLNIVKDNTAAISTFLTSKLANSIGDALSNSESALYAIAAAVWGWSNVNYKKKLNQKFTKTNPNSLFAPMVEAAKKTKEAFSDAADSVSSSSSPAQQVSSVTSVELNGYYNGILDMLSTINNSVNSLRGNITITGSSSSASNSDSSNSSRSNYNSKRDDAFISAMDVIERLEKLTSENNTKNFFGGKKKVKKIKKTFYEYKDLIELIITETNNIYKEVGVTNDGIAKNASDLILSVNYVFDIVREFDDRNAYEIKSNIKNAYKLIGSKKEDNKKNLTICGVNSRIKDLITEIYDSVYYIDLDKVNQYINTIETLFNSYLTISSEGSSLSQIDFDVLYKGIDNASELNKEICSFGSLLSDAAFQMDSNKEALSILSESLNEYIKLFNTYSVLTDATDISNVKALKTNLAAYISANDELDNFINNIGELTSKKQAVIDFAETANNLQNVISAMNALSGRMKLRVALGGAKKAGSYAKMAEQIVELANNIESELGNLPTKTLDKLTNKKSGKLYKVGILASALSDINRSFSMGLPLAILGAAGAKAAATSIVSIKTIIEILSDKEFSENLKTATDTESGTVGLLVTVAKGVGTIMAVGAMLLLVAIPAAVGFLALIPALLTFGMALKVINFIVGGDKYEEQTINVKNIASLIVGMGLCMLMGAALGGIVNAMFPQILGFTVALSFFIFAVLGTISLATYFGGGLEQLKENASAINSIILASSLIMLTGGMFLLLFPKVIVSALAFTILLGTFIFGTIGVVALAGRMADKSEKDMKAMAWFLVGATAALLVPAMILNAYPQLYTHIMLWGVIMVGFIGGISAAMRLLPKNQDLIKAAIAISIIEGCIAGMAVIFLVFYGVSQIIDDWVKFGGIVATAFACLGAMIFGLKCLDKVNTATLLKGVASLGALELVALGMAGVMYAFVKVSNITDFGKLWGLIGSAFGVLSLICAATIGLGALMDTGIGAAVFASGAAAVAAIEGLGWGMAKTFEALSEASKKEVEGKKISAMFDTMRLLMDDVMSFGTSPLQLLRIFMATRAVGMLGHAVSKIAKGVSDAADMHYTKYENGKKVGEFNLTEDDFTKAAMNTKKVVSVLGGAILDIYNENPEIFTTGTIIGDFIGNETKFEKVCRSVSMLGKVISKIAKGVSNMANLTFTKYVGGKSVGTFQLGKNEYKAAAENTKLIVSVLGKAIMGAYDANPDLFSCGSKTGNMITDSLFALGDMMGADTKFGRAAKSIGLLGNLISKIADGVGDMANLTITEYDKNGKEKKRKMNSTDFIMAAANTSKIVSFLGKTVMDTYEQHPEMFTSGSGLTDALGFNPKFKNVVLTISALGTMVSNIASGIQTYAEGGIPVYGKDGQVIRKDPMPKDIYEKAAQNIIKCVTTLGSAIMDVYDDNPDWFAGLGLFDNKVDTNNKFSVVSKTLTELASLISRYASVVSDYANGHFDILGADGKVITSVPIKENTYSEAAHAVSSCITILASSVIKTYNDNKDFFEEETFDPVMDALGSLCKLLGKYSSKVKDFANLTYDVYDESGKVVGKKHIGENEFTNVGKSISSIMSIMVKSVYSAYKDNKDLFKDTNADSNHKNSGKTWFEQIVNSFLSVSPLISAMSDAVKHYAELRIPLYNADGSKVIGSRALKDSDFDTASKNVGIIITNMVGAIYDVWKKEEYKTLFENASSFGSGKKDNTNPFYVISTALNAAATMVNAAADATQAVLNIKGFEKPNEIKAKLDERIPVMTGTLVNSINTAYQQGNGTGGNIFDDALSDKSKFKKVAEAMKVAAEVVTNAANTYSKISEMDWDKLTTVVGDGNDIKTNKVYKMIKGLAQPIVDIFNETSKTQDGQYTYNNLFSGFNKEDSMFFRIKSGIKAVAEIMGTVKTAYDGIDQMEVNDNITKKIRDMLTNLVNPLCDVYSNNKIAFDDIVSVTNVLENINPLNIAIKAIKAIKGGDADTPAMRVVASIRNIAGIMNVVKTAYDNIYNTRYEDGTGDKIYKMIKGLATAFSKENFEKLNIGDVKNFSNAVVAMAESVQKALTGEKDGAGLIGIYKTVDNTTDLFTSKGKTIKSITGDLYNMISYVGRVVNSDEFSEINNNSDVIHNFATNAFYLKLGISRLSTAYSLIPSERKDISYFIPYLSRLQNEIGNAPKLNEFITETDNLVKFNNSVNSLQVKNVEVLTKLFVEFNKFSSKFGNLDKFTQVLATKMAQCLTYLADQIRDSAKTINKSEQIQKKRQEQIQKTIEEFRKLADMGLEVTVKSAEVPESGSGMSGGDSGDTNSENNNNSSENKKQEISQSYGSGSTANNAAILQSIASDVHTIARNSR